MSEFAGNVFRTGYMLATDENDFTQDPLKGLTEAITLCDV